MKTTIILIAAALLAGCATKPHCVLLKFQTQPQPELAAALAATQPDTTPAEVSDWFKSGQRGFILRDTHTNEIAAAIAAGATAKAIQ